MALLRATGSFTKSVSAAPAAQEINISDPDAGAFQPKVVILWTGGGTTAGTWRADINGGYGFVVGTSAGEARSMAYASGPHGGSFTNASVRMADKALTLCDSSNTCIAECDLSSFDADGFTLSWTTNDANATIIHYLALGGDDLTAASIVSWLTNSSTGNQGVTGAGFTPDLVLHLLNGRNATPPSDATWSTEGFGLGAMTTAAQWALSFIDQDNLTTTSAKRSQRTDRTGIACAQTVAANRLEFSYVSMDADGFTVNIDTALQRRVFSLCLDIVGAKVGAITKPTDAAPTSVSASSFGFAPAAVLLASFQNPATTSQLAHGRATFGASDGTGQQASVSQMENAQTDQANAADEAIDLTSVAYRKVDNLTQTTDAEGTVSLDSDGFTLNLTTNDSDADEILYIAFGNASAAGIARDMFNGAQSPLFGGVIVR